MNANGSTESDGQQVQLARVSLNIKRHIQAFAIKRWQTNMPVFLMRELHDYIFEQTKIAPASPDRILRQLRLDGAIRYEVVNRRQSLYRLLYVRGTAQPAAA